MTNGIEMVVGTAPRMRTAIRSIEEPFHRAVALCCTRLDVGDVEVHVIDAPDEVIPEWGLGGYTYGPHTVVIAVDPDHVLDPLDVFSTVVHEIHHVVRWRGPGPGSSLAERLVTEGLAQVFEAEALGRPPLYAQGRVAEDERARAIRHLEEDPADEGRWFFGSKDISRRFGYRLGYDVVATALGALGSDASAMVCEPAATFDRWLH
ncbi:MAG: DUF2268 domain-containing putative Zn-dependent protease [Nocardioidaceae bacterium]